MVMEYRELVTGECGVSIFLGGLDDNWISSFIPKVYGPMGYE
jgi:hypothetical protein